ncbi:hypothetical protein KCH_76440 [Kitasatospora cheerisanensis KCTC 2395]|uniref:Uncharacterized protein n=1 Tax=Kitasatospora cheerisanensis KCTC 2395 TaxID=1348663 RepID=A0A066YRN3_9ACTN|nr:hypothetical protein KCH_76440 [Kitasatospora cheerisanensis KCTC 2395]
MAGRRDQREGSHQYLLRHADFDRGLPQKRQVRDPAGAFETADRGG